MVMMMVVYAHTFQSKYSSTIVCVVVAVVVLIVVLAIVVVDRVMLYDRLRTT